MATFGLVMLILLLIATSFIWIPVLFIEVIFTFVMVIVAFALLVVTPIALILDLLTLGRFKFTSKFWGSGKKKMKTKIKNGVFNIVKKKGTIKVNGKKHKIKDIVKKGGINIQEGNSSVIINENGIDIQDGGDRVQINNDGIVIKEN